MIEEHCKCSRAAGPGLQPGPLNNQKFKTSKNQLASVANRSQILKPMRIKLLSFSTKGQLND